MARIQIMEDEGCEMIHSDADGECKFEGNFWDLPPTTRTELPDLLATLDVEHEILECTYNE